MIGVGPNKKKDLRDFCYKLTLTAVHPDPEEAEQEGAFLSRLFRAVRDGRGELNEFLQRKPRSKSRGKYVKRAR